MICRNLLTALTAAAVCTAALAQDEPVRTLSQQFPVGDHSAVHTRLRIGELRVIGEDRDSVAVTSTIVCKKEDQAKCESASAGVGLTMTTTGGKMVIGMQGITEAALRKMRVSNEVRVPSGMPLEVDVIFGNAHVGGMGSDLNIDVGTGNAELTLSKAAVRSVNLDAGGNAELRVTGQKYEGKGVLHESLDWSDDDGSASVEVDVVIGDVTVILQ